MTLHHVVKAAGAVHLIRRRNHNNLEIDFYGHKATYWPERAVIVLRNPIDGKFMSLKAR